MTVSCSHRRTHQWLRNRLLCDKDNHDTGKLCPWPCLSEALESVPDKQHTCAKVPILPEQRPSKSVHYTVTLSAFCFSTKAAARGEAVLPTENHSWLSGQHSRVSVSPDSAHWPEKVWSGLALNRPAGCKEATPLLGSKMVWKVKIPHLHRGRTFRGSAVDREDEFLRELSRDKVSFHCDWERAVGLPMSATLRPQAYGRQHRRLTPELRHNLIYLT